MYFACILKSILRGTERMLIRPSPLGPPRGLQNTLEALNRKICFKNGEFCRFRLVRQSQFGNQTSIMLFGQQLRQRTKSCRMGRNSVHPSIHPSVRPSVHPSIHWGVRACQRGLRANREAHGEEILIDGGMDGWNFSPFYRTLSSVGAAAQKG